MLAAALQVGRASSGEGTDLIPLMDQLLRYCERHGLYTADFVHAHLLAIDTQMLGGGSPFGAWLAAGKAHHAALLVGVHLDRTGETLFEQEMRRRLWWNIKLARHTLAARLQIHVPLLDPDVPRPLVISDAQLQSEDLLETISVPEWAAIDARISFVNVIAARVIALAQDTPILDRFAECQRLLDDYQFTLPASLRLESATKTLPWGYAQACIAAIATQEAMLGVYRPFFADANTGAMALALGVDAAHRLIATSQLLASFLMFEWVDNAASTLWSGAASVFAAGTVLVYALLGGSGDRDKHLVALDTAIGVLRSHTAAPSAPSANAKAFATLETLARAIREGRAVDSGAVIDPFSGQSVVLPPPATFEWDTLFSLFPAA
ncbi:uncharacterized protein LOC62_01G001253 [Vanrija pseudolonga]|uniref:Transcription factor domain-containing protein n=1 Tax=Vanrija pseudolonga TaxID=143232 RepID=A0AAF0Y0E7_9TREE|nr:hypothetical protein LOC62_01G001253 [Vanrija pseudolonga]